LNITRFGKPMAAIAIAAGAAIALSACAGTPAPVSTLKGTITGSGATTQTAAQAVWAAGFQTANPNVTVNYLGGGSGQGVTDFFAGKTVYAGSDAALTTDELKKVSPSCAAGSTVFQVPNYATSIAVAFNVSGVDALKLDPATLAGIFSGKITKWDDPAIVALNPSAKLPSAAITAVHRSDSSGTTQNFTDYLAKTAPTVWTEKAAKVFPAAYKGEGANGTTGAVSTIKSGTNTIGYLDAADLGALKAASVKVGDSFVAFSPDTLAAAVAAATPVVNADKNVQVYTLNRTTTNTKEYPLALISYAIGCMAYADAANAELVKSYLTYVLSPAGQTAAIKDAGAAALGASQLTSANATIALIK
jgi:phosphate transport system substrate-binding protein